MSIDVGNMTYDQTIEHFKAVIGDLAKIEKTLDDAMPAINAAREMAENIHYRITTSNKVNVEAYRIGFKGTGNTLETCLEIQALIDACEMDYDRNAAVIHFGEGVKARVNK